MQRLQRLQRLSNLPISLFELLRRAASLQHPLRRRGRMLIMQELFQKVTVEEAVRRGVRVAFPPHTHGRTILGVRRVRDLGHDLTQVALERGQVKREFGARIADHAYATGGSKEE
jgi:hypothetical protein